MRILITGPQGSGKTTQANLIHERLGFQMIKAGELLRAYAAEPTDEGRKFKAMLDKGELVDDHLLADLIKRELAKFGKDEKLVIDGYPRRRSQIDTFDPKYDKVFLLRLNDKEGVERLIARHRADDTPEIIKRRLELYHQETEPMLDYYRQLGILEVIDASDDIEHVYAKIADNLNG